MTTYTWTRPATLVGFPITIYNELGAVVAVENMVASGGKAVCSIDLPAGTYTAKISALSEETVLTPDDASISGGGAGDTAYLTGTGTCSSDPNATGPITWVADSRHGALPAWLSISGGDVTLNHDAGPCAVTVLAAATAHFPTTALGTGTATAVAVDGPCARSTSLAINATAGNGTHDIVVPMTVSGVVLDSNATGASFVSSCNFGDSGNVAITDGTVTVVAVATITRLGTLPVLPS